jgi:hypothetical protein
MTSKVYRSAQGKSVDLGTIMLQNEHVRAVGNMKVNARGDKLDSNNQVIETKSRQIQRQNDRTSTNVSTTPVATSSKKARKAKQQLEPDSIPEPVPEIVVPPEIVASSPAQEIVAPLPVETPTLPQTPATPQTKAKASSPPKSPAATDSQTPSGGLAGAIARSREIKQELDKTRRQQAQSQGVKKI